MTEAEHYARAAVTSRIEVIERRRTDADHLMAAAWACNGMPRYTMALVLFRAASDCREGAQAIADNRPYTQRPGTLPGELRDLHAWSFPRLIEWSGQRAKPMRTSLALSITGSVIEWWSSSVCKACKGRGYGLIDGSPVTSDVVCTECSGHGKPPVERRLKKSQREAGRWLASEYDVMVSEVFGAMRQALGPAQRVDLAQWPWLVRRLDELRSAEAQEES